MLYEKKIATNVGVGLGIVLHVGAWLLRRYQPDLFWVYSPMALVGTVFFLWGCVNYSQAKGYAGAFGLFGLLSLPGLIVLVCFPDQCKDGYRPRRGRPRRFDNDEDDRP